MHIYDMGFHYTSAAVATRSCSWCLSINAEIKLSTIKPRCTEGLLLSTVSVSQDVNKASEGGGGGGVKRRWTWGRRA